MDHSVIGIALERYIRMRLTHPPVEPVMQKEVGE
jgi:hypothetical protein